MLTQTESYKLIQEFELLCEAASSTIKNDIENTKKRNIDKSKVELKKYGISYNKLDKEIDTYAKNIVSSRNISQVDGQLDKLASTLKDELDKITDNKIKKIVILNLCVYILNTLVTTILIIFFKKIGIKNIKIPSLIAGFIVSPIIDQLASKIEEKGEYKSGFVSKYGSLIVTASIHRILSGPPSVLARLTSTFTGIVINKLKWIFKEELDNPIIDKSAMFLRDIVFKCYYVMFQILRFVLV